MEFRILGQVEIRDGDRSLDLHGARERGLLAYLLLHCNEVVSRDRLIDELWGDEPPSSVTSAVHVYVSRLRKVLGANGARIVTRGSGYVLELDPDHLDANRFERLAQAGRQQLADGAPSEAAEHLRAALALWRGPPLSDVGDSEWARSEIRRLEELRLSTLEDRIDADLALGRHAELVPELEQLVAREPLRERLRGQLMLALYRSGRTNDALQVYAAGRRVFSEELGLDPSVRLRELEQSILREDASLDLGEESRRPDRRARRRRGLGLVLAAAAVGAGILTAVLVLTNGGSTSRAAVAVVPDSVAVIDATTNRVISDIPLGGGPAGIAAGAGAVWVADFDDETLVRIDAARAQIARSIGVNIQPRSVVVAAGRVWVTGTRELVRIDPRFNRVLGSVPLRQVIPNLGLSPWGSDTLSAASSGPAGIWVAHSVSAISQIDPSSGSIRRTITIDDAPVSLAVGTDELWAIAAGAGQLLAIDPATSRVTARVQVHRLTDLFGTAAARGIWVGVAVGDSSVWTPAGDGVSRIDPLTDGVVARIATGTGALGIAVDGRDVWVTNYLAGTVSRIDARTNKVVATIKLGNNPTEVAVAHNRVWVTVN